MGTHRLIGLSTTFGRAELRAACGLEDRTPTLDDVAHVLCLEVLDLTGDQSLVAAVDPLDADAVVDSRAGDRADGGIHAGCIAARGQYPYTFDCSHSCCSYFKAILYQFFYQQRYCNSHPDILPLWCPVMSVNISY